MLALHFSLANDAGVDVVNLLLDAHPNGAEHQDADGALPLHDAAFKGAGACILCRV